MDNQKKDSIISRDGVSYLIPFILVTSCFALWGFANDITNPMVKAFSKIFRMSVTDGALVQVAFYGGYFAMAFPAAMFIRKYSYKAGVLMGLGLYAVGALLFLPASWTGIRFRWWSVIANSASRMKRCLNSGYSRAISGFSTLSAKCLPAGERTR